MFSNTRVKIAGVALAVAVVIAGGLMLASTVAAAVPSKVGNGVLPLRFLSATTGAGVDTSALLGNWCERAQYQESDGTVTELLAEADKLVLECREVSDTATASNYPDTVATFEIPFIHADATLAEGGVGTAQLADGAVTAVKAAPGTFVLDRDRAVLRMLPKKKATRTRVRTSSGVCCYQQNSYFQLDFNGQQGGTRNQSSDPVAYLGIATVLPEAVPGGVGIANRTRGGEAIHIQPWQSNNQNSVVGVTVGIWGSPGSSSIVLRDEGPYVGGGYIPIPAQTVEGADVTYEMPFTYEHLQAVGRFRWDHENRELVHEGYFEMATTSPSETFFGGYNLGNVYWVHYRGTYGP